MTMIEVVAVVLAIACAFLFFRLVVSVSSCRALETRCAKAEAKVDKMQDAQFEESRRKWDEDIKRLREESRKTAERVARAVLEQKPDGAVDIGVCHLMNMDYRERTVTIKCPNTSHDAIAEWIKMPSRSVWLSRVIP